MLRFKDQRLLIIAPHPDDEVLGCGGLIHRCKNEGGEVYVLYITVGTTKDFSEAGISTKEERMQEIEKAARYLEIDGYRLLLPGNEHHLKLDALPQKVLIDAIERGEGISLQAIEPTIVAIPLPNDYNQDHRAACLATITATRPSPPTFRSLQSLVLQYELPSNAWTDRDSTSTMNLYVSLSEENLRAKTEALNLYKSQMKHAQSPLSVYGVETLARMRGLESGTRYAEAYYAKRILV